MSVTRKARTAAAVALALAVVAATSGEAQETIYVVNVGSNDVSLIDTASREVIAVIPVGTQPNGVAVTPDGRTAYVSNLQDDTISVIDAATRAVSGTIAVGDEPVGIAVSPDGATAYVANRASNTVSIIDTATQAVVGTIADGVGPGSNGLALTPDGALLFVNNARSRDPGTLSVIDTARREVIDQVAVARNPKRVAIAPDGRTAYVANFRSWNISIADVPTASYASALRVSGRTVGVAVHPNGQYAYITNLDGTVEILETANGLLTVPITVGREPYAIALTGQGAQAYVANLGDGTVSVVDLATDTVVDTVAVGDKPFALARGCIGAGCDLPPFTPKPTRTVTPIPTSTTTPTITPTRPPTATMPPPPDAARLGVQPASGRPGERVEVAVTFDSLDIPIAGVQLLLVVEPPLAIAARSDGRPDCDPNPETGKSVPSSFQPVGCREDCRAARVLVLSLTDVNPIPNPTTLFVCRVDIPADAAGGSYAVEARDAVGSTPDAKEHVVVGASGSITVTGAAARAVIGVAGEGLCTSGVSQGAACQGDADCGVGGACVRASSVCDGGPDDGLLCDCPGGVCEAGGSCEGEGLYGTCRGGRADGRCCDPEFSCAGERPCAPTTRVCAAGVAKGMPCHTDRHCPESTCRAADRRCDGGTYHHYACIDDQDCPGGICQRPFPSSTPHRPMGEESVGGAASGGSGGGGGCAVTEPAGDARWLALLLAAILVRRRRSAR